MNVFTNLCIALARNDNDQSVYALDKLRWIEIATELKLVKSTRLVKLKRNGYYEFIRNPSKCFPLFAGPRWFMRHPEINIELRRSSNIASKLIELKIDYFGYLKWEGRL